MQRWKWGGSRFQGLWSPFPVTPQYTSVKIIWPWSWIFFPELILVVFLKKICHCEDEEVQPTLSGQIKANPDTGIQMERNYLLTRYPFSSVCKFWTRDRGRKVLLGKCRIEKYNINVNDVYNMRLTFLVSETQPTEWLLTLQRARLLCKWFATGDLWVMSSSVHSVWAPVPKVQPALGPGILEREVLLTWCTCFWKKGAQLVSWSGNGTAACSLQVALGNQGSLVLSCHLWISYRAAKALH